MRLKEANEEINESLKKTRREMEKPTKSCSNADYKRHKKEHVQRVKFMWCGRQCNIKTGVIFYIFISLYAVNLFIILWL